MKTISSVSTLMCASISRIEGSEKRSVPLILKWLMPMPLITSPMSSASRLVLTRMATLPSGSISP